MGVVVGGVVSGRSWNWGRSRGRRWEVVVGGRSREGVEGGSYHEGHNRGVVAEVVTEKSWKGGRSRDR